jgi:hypothetical protein
MTITAAPDLKPDHPEGEQPPAPLREFSDPTQEHPDARSCDPTQGRKIASDPYDDPTRPR